jgi:hypothetical protein
MPRRVGFGRIFMMMLAALHLSADRARIESADTAGRRHAPKQDFVDDLVDMAQGALFAPHRRTAEQQPSSV